MPVSILDQAPTNTDGVEPLFLTFATQKLFNVRIGEEVTNENRYRLLAKEDILGDIEGRGIVSDFYPVREKILTYPEDEILLVFDEEQKYKKNFYLCLSKDLREKLIGLKKAASTRNMGGSSTPKEVEEKQIVLSTEEQIAEETIKPTRDQLRLNISRKKREFGVPCRFSDSDAHDSLVECRQQRNTNFDLMRLQKDVGIQAVPLLTTKTIQTPTFALAHNAVQAAISLLDEEDVQPNYNEVEIREFLSRVEPLMTEALLQNETINIFVDDLQTLGDDDLVVGDKSETLFLKEFQSFTDFEFSNDKTISFLDWKPDSRGVVAVACVDKGEFEEKLSKGRHNGSVILVWDFVDPIHPQLILEAPSDVTVFRYNPKKPNIIIGGCVNGQVVYWDIESSPKKVYTIQQKKSGTNEEEETKRVVTLIPFLVSSAIENSHKRAVSSINWLPELTVSSSGELRPLGGEYSYFLSVGGDGRVLIWEINLFQGQGPSVAALDLTWAPMYSVNLGIEFRLNQALWKMDGKNVRVYLTTEDFQVLWFDWNDANNINEKAIHLKKTVHFGSVVCLEESPFFPEILITGGDWRINIWNDNVEDPLLTSPSASSTITVTKWSPTRPAVFYVGKSDGTLDIWDLLDKSHTPIHSQIVCSGAITSMDFFHSTQSTQQMLAIGDNLGRLHILELPRNLTRKLSKENFFNREELRVSYICRRMAIRREEYRLLAEIQEQKKKQEEEERLRLEAEEKERQALDKLSRSGVRERADSMRNQKRKVGIKTSRPESRSNKLSAERKDGDKSRPGSREHTPTLSRTKSANRSDSGKPDMKPQMRDSFGDMPSTPNSTDSATREDQQTETKVVPDTSIPVQ